MSEEFEHVIEGTREGFRISASNGQHKHTLALVPSHMPEVARFLIVCLDAFDSTEKADAAREAEAKLAKVREFMEKKLDPKFWVAKELTAILQGDSK